MLAARSYIIRSLHGTSTQMAKSKRNPGMGRQIQEYENEASLQEDPEGFGDLESDFMHVDKTHRQHEQELEKQRENVRHKIVAHKYFREQQLPNMLLYAEKEEIRTLHSRDPEEWTVERLAESFPATPEIVNKVLASKWKPHSIKRIRKHDEVVIRNWELLKSGHREELLLPEELRQHLLKFAARTLTPPQISSDDSKSLLPELPKPKHKEFVNIIETCKKYASQNKAENRVTTRQQPPTPVQTGRNTNPEDETFLIGEVHDKRRMRFQELQQMKLGGTALASTDSEGQTTAATASIAKLPDNPSGTGYIEKFESNEIIVSEADSKRYEMTRAKDRIYIPRKLWRRGGTFRVEDSYYDDDGEFLYRVPGMSGTQKPN